VPANESRFWDRAARKYAASPIADPEGYERTLARTRELLKSTDIVLEIGCGTGTTALNLAASAARIVATDISPEMIAIGREKAISQNVGNVEFAVATPEAPPSPEQSFDAVLAFSLLHLVAARGAALQGVYKALKPGGLFISKTPSLKEMNPLIRLAVPPMQLFGIAPYVAFFSAEELEADIEAAGFFIVERARHATRGKDTRPFLVARKR
jgi:ubiquinone/menaquinone biosynthesis C-methylase UbiE